MVVSVSMDDQRFSWRFQLPLSLFSFGPLILSVVTAFYMNIIALAFLRAFPVLEA